MINFHHLLDKNLQEQRNYCMSHYQLKSFLLILWFLCCAVFLFNPSVSYASVIEAKILKQQLSKPASSIFTKTEIANLQRFYAARNYQSVWIAAEPESSSLEIALTFIASAETEGLDSRDYQLQQLRRLQQQAAQS